VLHHTSLDRLCAGGRAELLEISRFGEKAALDKFKVGDRASPPTEKKISPAWACVPEGKFLSVFGWEGDFSQQQSGAKLGSLPIAASIVVVLELCALLPKVSALTSGDAERLHRTGFVPITRENSRARSSA
jgi:hypothetical protein